MKAIISRLSTMHFTELDKQIAKLRALRDSYVLANSERGHHDGGVVPAPLGHPLMIQDRFAA